MVFWISSALLASVALLISAALIFKWWKRRSGQRLSAEELADHLASLAASGGWERSTFASELKCVQTDEPSFHALRERILQMLNENENIGSASCFGKRGIGKQKREFEIAAQRETERRRREIQLIVNIVEPDPEYQPFLLTDEASVLEVSAAPVDQIRERIEYYLGEPLPVPLTSPLWKLVDALQEEFPGWPNAGPPGDIGPVSHSSRS